MSQEEEYYEEDPFEETSSRMPAWLAESPWWAASALIHAIALVLFAYYIVGTVESKKEEKKTVVRREFPPPKYDPTRKRAMERKPQVLNDQKKKPIIMKKLDVIKATKPKGKDLNKMTNKNLEDDAISDLAGLAGGAAGAYGFRNGKGSLTNEGGSEATESAVLAALYWLTRHQHPDGYWSAHAFTEQCSKGTCKNKPGGPLGEDGLGFKDYDIGVTALAMLAYMGFGHTHQGGQYKEFKRAMRKATRWMLKQQNVNPEGTDDDTAAVRGIFGPVKNEKGEEIESWVYNHAIASMAMAELLGMTSDARLRRSVTEATEWILRAQNPGLGWKYGYQDAANDSSVTGWMILGLKGAKLASAKRLVRIDAERFDKSFEDAIVWFDRVTSAGSGVTGYEAPGDPGSALDVYGETYPFYKQRMRCMTAVAVWCRILAGQKRSDAVKKGVSILMEHLPEWRLQKGKLKSTINMYHWYYATNAMFQYGGTKWKKWNTAMQDALLVSQRQGDQAGDEDGSWDPIGEWGPAGGRVYSTAIGALTLEVYYRYERAQ